MQAPYFLQPKNATQAAGSNWYNVAYRRAGSAYKGFGQYDQYGNYTGPMYDSAGNYIGPSIGTDAAGNPIPAANYGPGASIKPAAAVNLGNYWPFIIAGLLILLVVERK